MKDSHQLELRKDERQNIFKNLHNVQMTKQKEDSDCRIPTQNASDSSAASSHRCVVIHLLAMVSFLSMM